MQTAFIPTTYEDKVAVGIELRQTGEKVQWALGDLGASFVPEPRQGVTANLTLTQYAGDVGLSVRRMQEYTQMSLFYAPTHRQAFPNLTWTHFREALRYRKEDIECALEALEIASQKGLNTTAFKAWLEEHRQNDVQALKSALQEALEVIRGFSPAHPQIERIERILHGNQE